MLRQKSGYFDCLLLGIQIIGLSYHFLLKNFAEVFLQALFKEVKPWHGGVNREKFSLGEKYVYVKFFKVLVDNAFSRFSPHNILPAEAHTVSIAHHHGEALGSIFKNPFITVVGVQFFAPLSGNDAAFQLRVVQNQRQGHYCCSDACRKQACKKLALRINIKAKRDKA